MSSSLVMAAPRRGFRNLISVLALLAMIAALLPVLAGPARGDSHLTPIYDIQGKQHVSPFDGQFVWTSGVVTAVAFNGFYVQDPFGDGDPDTSDGIFVFQFGNIPNVGDFVEMRDRVTEFVPGPSDAECETGNLSTTQMSFPNPLINMGPVHPIPAPSVIGRSGRVPPNVITHDEGPTNLQPGGFFGCPGGAGDDPAIYDPANDGIDFYESLEGMLVTVDDPVAVSAVRQFSAFSAEFFALANNGADAAPDDVRTSRGGINLAAGADGYGDTNPERVKIQFDPTLFGSFDYPSVKVGDRFEDITGVVGYNFGNFQVFVLEQFGLELAKASNIKPEKAVGAKEGFLSVASYNVLNLSARDLDDAQRDKIADQIVKNLKSPDVIALQEIQDNNGDAGDCEDLGLSEEPDGPCGTVLSADETLQKLVDAIYAAGGPEYSFFDVEPLEETTQTEDDGPDVFGGTPLGNIRNAFLYNPDRVDLVSFTGLTRNVLDGRGVSAYTAFDFSRDPLEAVFEFNGQDVVVVNNHLTSRFGSTPIFGGPQPFVQFAEATREAQALANNEIAQWHLDNGHENVVVLGDMNTFEFTNDLTDILPGTIMENLVDKDKGDNKYTFIFDGNSQVLDHIFVTDNLAKKAKFDIVHVNVDFPRLEDSVVGSDHEPIVSYLKIGR